MERCPDFARGPPGRGGEGEEGFAFAVSLGMKPNMGRLGISGAAFYPVRLNLEIISPSGLVLGSVGFEQRKHRKVKELSSGSSRGPAAALNRGNETANF